MRAIGQDSFGGPDVLKVVEVARPEPGPAEVLVRVHAAGVNPTDWWHRATGGLAGDVPVRLGWDVSGVIEAVGPGVTLFGPGDEVFGMPRQPLPAGTYAEYVVSPARHLVAKPVGLSHVDAAALPLAALTAWQALVDTADVRPGRRVLIHAATGGVGHLAVQIAKARGAHVIGTARTAKLKKPIGPERRTHATFPLLLETRGRPRAAGRPLGRHKDGGRHRQCAGRRTRPRETAGATEREVAALRERGYGVTEVDLRDYFDDPDGLAQRLSGFGVASVHRGNPFVLRPAMARSGADTILTGLLRRDAIVYAGWSAGACILSPSLHGLELVDDPKDTEAAYGEAAPWAEDGAA
ncbi:alcohol dehydrogenase catalytic domain-containing protein [Streptomyces sp. H10-C2]|uniref:alcohol dehydrogenase catalytic domain-containing protein n=1 Tax=unclassified Streptomyces TaxID=2593676 RepID=UPI0024BA813E|nr:MULTISPECIES: alcohol dehydrogenase catalytic domain-containing protein [unclassified Streptomyces]MDJ0346216.1 alcohol dehydrogenase catalytic domain-containing protein [Streptomyces sp. PH10-H1]MDJ0371730.1 alcohol dehydrogenase catalytic domain-containing protein [Streptomyces sp. H10-C2]